MGQTNDDLNASAVRLDPCSSIAAGNGKEDARIPQLLLFLHLEISF